MDWLDVVDWVIAGIGGLILFAVFFVFTFAVFSF